MSMHSQHDALASQARNNWSEDMSYGPPAASDANELLHAPVGGSYVLVRPRQLGPLRDRH